MTISLSDNTPRVSYTVSQGATQTSFTVAFEFFATTDLNVYVDGVKKTLTTHYTVSGGNGSTGTVTISVTGATGGSTVVITRGIPLERTTDFPVSGAFQVETLNTELDRFVAIQADNDDKTTRAIHLSDEDDAVDMELPNKASRIGGKVLSFHETTGAVQVQEYASPTATEGIGNVTPGTVSASKFLQVDANRNLATIGNLTSDGTITATNFVIGSAAINEANLEAIDDITAGTVAANKALIVDSNKDIASLRNVTAQSLNLTLDDDTNAIGPILDFTRTTDTPANNDYIMNLRATSKDSGGNDTEYARMAVYILDPTNGNEDGAMQFYCTSGGSLSTWLTHTGDSFQITAFSQNVTFASNKTVYAYNGIFFPDDETIKLGNNESTPDYTISFDEASSDSLQLKATSGSDFKMNLVSTGGNANGDTWEILIDSNDKFGLRNNTSGSQVEKFAVNTQGEVTANNIKLSSASQDNNLIVESTNGGGARGPLLELKRSSSSPADDDILGQLKFTGHAEIASSTHDATYASIQAQIVDHEGNQSSTFSQGSLSITTYGSAANGNTSYDYLFKDNSLTIPHKTIIFEGETADEHETSFVVTEPTADRTVTFKNESGTVAYLSDISAGGLASLVADTSPELGGHLDVLNKKITTSTSNQNIVLEPNGTGLVEIYGDGTTDGSSGAIKINCSNNNHGITIKSPAHSVNATYTLTLPNTDGNANEVLKTDGSGNLDWVAQSSGGITTGKAIAMAMIFG